MIHFQQIVLRFNSARHASFKFSYGNPNIQKMSQQNDYVGKKTQEIHNKITPNHVERSTQLKEYSYPDNIWQKWDVGTNKKR
jgi:hypothetical protein